MTRASSPTSGATGAPSFLRGGGEAGALMRGLDWSRSPLGSPETWPASLRAVVGLLLGSKFPMFVAWGKELGFLYNDAYAEILEGKHPAAMGGRFHDIWSEIWPDISPMIETAMGGEATYQDDLPLVMNRRGFDELTWFTFSYSPVHDDAGAVGGMFCAVIETTERVLAERRQKLLVELDDRIRDISDPAELKRAAAELLAAHLQADRVHWVEIDEAASLFRVEEEWSRGDACDLTGEHRFDLLSEPLVAAMRQGRTVAVDDILCDPLTAAWGADGSPAARSLVAAPLIRGEQWQGALSVHMLVPRVWREDDRRFVREFAERVWTAAQRAHAEDRVRRSEQRFRALVQASSDIIFRMSADWSEMRELDGRGFLVNVDAPSVAWLDAYVPKEDQPIVSVATAAAIRAKAPVQVEHRVRQADGRMGWVSSRAIPLLDDGGEIIEWFGAASDVTGRKDSERRLRLMVNELNHRVKNSLATVQAIANQTLRREAVPPAVRDALSARLVALAGAHDVLTQESWSGADLRELAEQAAAPYAAEGGVRRFRISGPPVALPPKTAIAVALAFHELATNAAKYGALSTPEGQVELSWTAAAASQDGRRLRLSWREVGGPPVTPPREAGFGTRLIERGLAADLNGTVALAYPPTGVTCEIEAVVPEPDPAEQMLGLA